MIVSLLGITALFTLILNLILVGYLLEDKLAIHSNNNNKKEVINFVLSPHNENKTDNDTDMLATELIFKNESENEYNE
ncbi:MAG: hypothetical protein K0Q65_2355 [Clostridia bacterium]|nr:hypothetical protein [Clostridia bacterium]